MLRGNKRQAISSLCLTALIVWPAVLHAGDADDHAPIGVMADHYHRAGEWMFSYRFMAMGMDGNRDGSDPLSASDVRGRGYPVVPVSMNMQMHMFGAMYAPRDWVTVMAMVPVLDMSMKHQAGMPLGSVNFTTESAGLGDISLTAMFPVLEGAHGRVQLNGGFALPSGAIHVRDDTPAQDNARLPYPMRLGAGAVSLRPGISYSGQVARLSWGAQVAADLPLYRNEDGYRAPMLGRATSWLAWAFAPWISTSCRLAGVVRSNIDGADDDLNAAMVPTTDPNLRAGKEIEAFGGVNLAATDGILAGHRLAVEFGLPLYRSLDGPQLERDWTLILGWQLSL